MNERAETATDEVVHVRSHVSLLEILWVSTRLGLTSFGGPIAHLGYFHEEYVKRKRWVDEQSYADLVALCQSLPGPTSSMVGTAIGFARAGVAGGLVHWFGFTLPSALALIAFAYGIGAVAPASGAGWLHGLKLVAVPVVALAVWGMARALCPDRERATLAILTAIVALAWPTALGQVLPIIAAGLIGWRLFPPPNTPPALHIRVPISRWVGTASWVLFFGLLLVLPLIRQAASSQTLSVFDSFYRAGALVFGGGHVVLPLLQAEVVAPGWVTNDQFVGGYGAAQAVPGPLFTFAAYLGWVMQPPLNGWAGASVALVAIFLPGVLMTLGALPFWDILRTRASFQSAIRGINAAVACGCADGCRRRTPGPHLRQSRRRWQTGALRPSQSRHADPWLKPRDSVPKKEKSHGGEHRGHQIEKGLHFYLRRQMGAEITSRHSCGAH
ncbi:MAG: chromate efflux transporter [Deltaproteobacteria bacterium]|nr:chromate efflux transporter [Deltaproteobacteria bacterium]